MTSKIVFMFSGQGSQYFHMGQALYRTNPRFRDCMDELDELAAAYTGEPVVAAIYDPSKRKSDRFTDAAVSSAAIFMVECSLAFTLRAEGIEPDFVLGASLGEFAAAVVAGVLGREQAMALLVGQARAMVSNCALGAVAAVLASSRMFHELPSLHENTDLGFDSGGDHFVIAGDQARMARALAQLRARGVPVHELPVAYGFHSYNLDPAAAACRELCPHDHAEPSLAFVSCVHGRRVSQVERGHFWRTAREPMRVVEAARDIAASCDHALYIDLGPTGTMANLVGYLPAAQQGRALPSMNQFGADVANLEAIHAACRRPRPRPRPRSRKPRPALALAWVFPGQGSQVRGMGGELFDAYPKLVREADELLGFSVKELCLSDPEGHLNDTRYTQPALFVVNALHTARLREESGGREPAFVAGHSLGEYNALFAAGVLDFRTALTIVKRRGELMAQSRLGGMAAVLGMTEQQVWTTLAKNRLDELDVANLNSESQIVISGSRDALRAARPMFEAAGCRNYVPLEVSGAFHSRLMWPAATELARFVRDIEPAPAKIPVISNVSARPLVDGEVRQRMAEHLIRPVRWADTIRFLLRRGVDEFVELGPGQVLTKLIHDIRGVRALRRTPMLSHRPVVETRTRATP